MWAMILAIVKWKFPLENNPTSPFHMPPNSDKRLLFGSFLEEYRSGNRIS